MTTTQGQQLPHQFIETESLNQSGGKTEQKVWDACKKAFKGRECLGFWRFPIFSKVGEKRKEPDILVIDRQLGIIVIEVKGLNFDQIQSIQGASWSYANFYEDSGNPYEQAENHLYAILGWSDKESRLRRKVRGRALVALPNIKESDWLGAKFNEQLSCPPIIFGDSLTPASLLSQLENTPPVQSGNNFGDYEWALLLSIIGGSRVIGPPSTGVIETGTASSRQAILNKLSRRIYSLSMQQLKIATEIPAGVQRIRGIAGSGKSVMLCQKAAHMYLKHPEWDIALVFFTRSLYDQMEQSVDKWLRHFTNGEVCYDSKVRSKLKILHAWGAKNRPGFYRYICERNGERPLTVAHTRYKNPSEGLADHCLSLLKKGIPREPLFDAVLIDEGQDLVIDEPALKIEGKQPFYWMAYQSLRISDSNKPEQRRLIWAYDDAQSMDTLKIPSAIELFGDNSLLQGNHEGGMQKTHIMRKTYRTPGVIMAAAQALGMGILRSEGMLKAGITRKSEWEDLGYELKGDFRKSDSKITLTRPHKNSPNPVPALWEGDCIQFKAYSSRQEELEALAKNIKYNLNEEGLSPDRQILVIVLGATPYKAMDLETYVASFLAESGIDTFIPSGTRLNQFKPKYPDNDPDAFWHKSGVTISRIVRAKGNEADLVYVVGLDSVAHNEGSALMRNQLLVAMTRARGWLNMSGVKDSNCYPFYDEVNSVINSKCEFTFTYKKTLDESDLRSPVPA